MSEGKRFTIEYLVSDMNYLADVEAPDEKVAVEKFKKYMVGNKQRYDGVLDVVERLPADELPVNSEELPEYDQDEAVEFIQNSLKGMNKQYINRGFLVAVLDAEEDYMRSKGIIED